MMSKYTNLLLFCVGQVLADVDYRATEFNGHQVEQDDGCVQAYSVLSQEDLSRYIDASGKPGSGIYGGNFLWFGSYDECKKLKRSRYCLATFDGLYNFGHGQQKIIPSLQWGACVPENCTQEMVKENILFLLNNVSKIPIGLSSTAKASKPPVVDCPEKADYTTGVILTIIFCGVIIALCLIGTSLEIMSNYASGQQRAESSGGISEKIDMEQDTNEISPLLEKPSKSSENTSKVSLYDILHCFSAIRNTNFILNTNVGKNDLSYLHGIRVLSLFWVIMIHVTSPLLFASHIPVDNAYYASTGFFRHFPARVFLAGGYAVDTFFVLSGLLVMYVNLLKREKNRGKINWFKFFFHRFWRLTPSYMVAILLLTKLRPFLGDGPWLSKIQDTSGCSEHWWKNLLYINNFGIDDKICIGQTWYLAADMQFYNLSPIFIVVFLRYGFRPFAILGSLVIFAAMVTTGILVGVKDLVPIPYAVDERELGMDIDFGKEVYQKPYCRIQAYVVGLFMGCIIFRNIGKKFYLKWYWVVALWLLSVGVALVIVYAPYNALKTDPHEWTTGENVIYASVQWTLWGLCVAWLIFACHFGYAGLVRSILAEKFWIPLSRINYAAFILHFDIINIVVWNMETPIHFTAYTFVSLFLGILFLCYAVSFIFAVVVELPFANIEGLLLEGRKK